MRFFINYIIVPTYTSHIQYTVQVYMCKYKIHRNNQIIFSTVLKNQSSILRLVHIWCTRTDILYRVVFSAE